MHGGSTTKSLTGSRLGWVLRFSAAAVVVMLGANLLVVAAERRLPDPLRYYSDRVQTLVTEMDRLQAAGVRSDLVFAGTSQAGARDRPPDRRPDPRLEVDRERRASRDAGPDHQAVAARGGRTSAAPAPRSSGGSRASTSTAAAPTRGSTATTPRVGDAARGARRSRRDLPERRRRRASPIAAPRPLQARHRLQDGKPADAAAAAAERAPRPDVHAPRPLSGAPRRSSGTCAARLLGNFRVTPEYLDAFRTTLEQLHRDGVETAVVIMPVSTQFREATRRAPSSTKPGSAWPRAPRRPPARRSST